MEQNTQSSEVEQPPLVEWKNAPKLSDLKQDLQDAKPAHDLQVTKIKTWLDNLHVRGAAKPKPPKGNSAIQPKLIRKQAEWRYSSLSEPFLSTDDIFKVGPTTWADRKGAIQNQILLNHQFNTGLDKVTFIDEYVRAAVDEGSVIVRTGWDFVEEEYEAMTPDVEYRINPAFAPMHQQLDQMQQSDPVQYDAEVPDELKTAHEMTQQQGQPIEPVVTGHSMKKLKRTLCNKPTAEVCDYRNVIIDPTAKGDIKKAKFVIYSFDSSLSELKKDGKYKNLDKIVLSNNGPLNQPDHASPGTNIFNFHDEPRKQIVVYEYWGLWDIDGSGTVKPIVAAWVGETLIRMEENPYPDKKIPFIIKKYLPVRNHNYGEPDGELLEDNQKVAGAVTRGMIDIMGKSANGQTGIRKDMLDVTNRRKFDGGQDYEFNPNVDPRQGVFMHTYPEIPQSAQYMLQLQNMEAESLTGVKSFSEGVSGQSLGDVAAGVRGALDASSKRELGILRRIGAGIIEIGHKWISMNTEFLSDKEVIQVTNDQFVMVRKEDLPGEYNLKLSISTAEVDDNKAQQLAFMLQTGGPSMGMDMTKMILSDIARLRKMPDLAKRIEDYTPQPDPIAQQKAQLELTLLQAQIATEQAKAAHFSSGANLHQAKVDTEGAKAANIQSDTDQKNLDFVEQESGTKQERDLQKVSQQANSQVQLKAIDLQAQREKNHNDLVKQYVANKQKKAA